MAFVENLADFLNDDTPGYVLAVLDGVEVGGIFDNGSDSALNNMMLGTNPTFTLASASASSSSRGKTLVVDSVSYTVREVKPDGTGMTVLELEKAS